MSSNVACFRGLKTPGCSQMNGKAQNGKHPYIQEFLDGGGGGGGGGADFQKNVENFVDLFL